MRLPSINPTTCSVHIAIIVAFAGLVLSFNNFVSAQTPATHDAFPSHEVAVEVDSKDIYHDKERSEVVWEETIELPDATWLRLYFDRLVLAQDVEGKTSSILRITSLEDGAVQSLDATTAKQWNNTSAYFNGSGVKLELIAYPNGRLNRVSVIHVDSGEVRSVQNARSICGAVDDRVLSADPRVCRVIPTGCTAWLFNDRNNCLLSAGHCAGSANVVEFNVPLSNPTSGNLRFSAPEDQYMIDRSSIQSQTGLGNDWCYFGCFDNAITGLSPFEAQQASFTLAMPPALEVGDALRITGHGNTFEPVDGGVSLPLAYNGAQKTHVGEYHSSNRTAIRVRTDATSGDSGAPIILESDGTAIGIFTHNGCSLTGGFNQGTGTNHEWLQDALANPLGICNETRILLGDCNHDGAVNFLDIQPFIESLFGGYLAEADTDEDGFVNFLDIAPFIEILSP